MRFNPTNQLQTITPSQPAVTMEQYLLAPEGRGIVGSIYTHNDRTNQYNAWSSGGPWTTYVSYGSYTDNSLIQFINMLLGDGYPVTGTSEAFMGGAERESYRNIQWAHGNRVGHVRDISHLRNSTSYGGSTFRILPIRNQSPLPISTTISAYISNHWSAGYEGGCLFVLWPNQASYSNPGIINSSLLSNTQGVTPSVALGGTFTIPGNTTVLACLDATDWQQTTNLYVEKSLFYNLSTTFANPNLICDMRMLTSLAYSRFNLPQTGSAVSTSLLAPLWTVTAQNFGDR